MFVIRIRKYLYFLDFLHRSRLSSYKMQVFLYLTEKSMIWSWILLIFD